MTADLTRMVVSCEFSGQLEMLDADATRVLKLIDLNSVPTSGASTEMSGHRPGPTGVNSRCPYQKGSLRRQLRC
jgi:hypothetical protein